MVLLVGGCSLTGSSAPNSTSPTPSVTASSEPLRTLPPPPEVGACYRLTYAEATSPTTDRPATACKRVHTSVTIHVGRFDPLVDGHLVAVDSPTVSRQIARACPATLADWVGGSPEDRRLSQLRVVWFAPTLAEGNLGARWFRCDLVAVRDDGALARLPRGQAKGMFASGTGGYALCATGDPAAATSRLVMCAQKHTWRAVATIPVPDGARYLDKGARSAGADACKTRAADFAGDPLDYRWSFQWPTRGQWRSGERASICWVPSNQ